jgi:hypothetical protein
MLSGGVSDSLYRKHNEEERICIRLSIGLKSRLWIWIVQWHFTATAWAEFRLESAACMTMAVFHYEEPVTGGALVYSEALKPSVDGVVVYLFTPDINASWKKWQRKAVPAVLDR